MGTLFPLPSADADEILQRRDGKGLCIKLDAAADAPLPSLPDGTLILGKAAEGLDLLPAGSVQTVVTSPPYWSLRDYDVDDRFGRDDSLRDYVASLVADFEKLRRVLVDNGTVWLNIGDAYTSGNRRYRAPDRKNRARAMSVRPPTPDGLKPKDLIGLPWRVTFALQEAGWWLRSEVIWHKPNAHPESVRDRPTRAHETVFLLSKAQDYFYDVTAIRGVNDRRLRTVWDIPTSPRRRENGDEDDHPAPMPMTLARQCVMLTSAPGDAVLDPYAGSGTTLLAAAQLQRRWAGIEVKPGVRTADRATDERMTERHRLKAGIDKLSPMAVRFVTRLVKSLATTPEPDTISHTWLTENRAWLEYFGLAISAHHGTAVEPLGLGSFEIAFRNACEAVGWSIDVFGSATHRFADLTLDPGDGVMRRLSLKGLASAAQVAIDRSDAKFTIRRIQLSACTVHAEWRLAY